ncbi:hypothetical protein [Streptomyces sp. MZ04]|uniref:hypothetical protein n=1 Tax=Streptomyces sp. MZ04 TaxID=2559236 RepID=UPI00107EE450|nr:hypothetical protein [Streptomyces sp. MZ04]TGB16034.1 hypothetical protein E2651_00865 [Streptomyces sp. MZ04]
MKNTKRVLAALIGAATLLLTVPGSASAAEGEFRYTYVTAGGDEGKVTLHDPASEECITLPEAAVEYAQPPAHSPKNRTDSTAVVFTNADCTGDWFSLRPFTGGASERLKLRSVIFS